VQIAAKNAAADTVEQAVYFVEKRNKPTLLKHVITEHGMSRVIVFTRTKHGADKVAHSLAKAGIRAEAIHGNKSQNARQRSLANFKSQKPPVLVATDVAARGLDIDEVSHVVNYDMPDVAETYVHRIGRTGRAGQPGTAISLVTAEEQALLHAVERLLKRPIERVIIDGFEPSAAVLAVPVAAGPAGRPDSRTRAASAPRGRHGHDRSHQSDGPMARGSSTVRGHRQDHGAWDRQRVHARPGPASPGRVDRDASVEGLRDHPRRQVRAMPGERFSGHGPSRERRSARRD
jgi:ATP-dependent RNA helicase RhlE